jgi:hypothetical protein
MLENSKRKGGKISNFANSMSLANSFGQGCWQSWASPEARVGFVNSFGPCCWQRKLLAKLGFFANSLVQRFCQQHGPMLLANQAVGKAVVPFANRTLPTVVASLLARITAAELTASPLRQRYTWLLAKLSQQGPRPCWRRALSPSLKTPTVLSQQELGNPVGKAFANRVGVFANSLTLLAKRAFPVVHAMRRTCMSYLLLHLLIPFDCT